MNWPKPILTVAFLLACFSALSRAEAVVIVKVADEWGTIQRTGARPANNGNRFWNIGGDATASASSGTLRFYMQDVVANLNSLFPQGWVVSNFNLVFEHDDSVGITADGFVNVFHFTDDTVAITNGASPPADAAPGNFAGLGVSPLVFDHFATADGLPVRVRTSSGPADLGDVTFVGDYVFFGEGDGDLDVLGLFPMFPFDAIDAQPNYGLNFPDVNSPDEHFTFEEMLQGIGVVVGSSAIFDDIQTGSDPLSFIFAASDFSPTVTATYKGNAFGDRYPPRIYIEAFGIPEPASALLLVIGTLGFFGRRRTLH